MLVPAQAVHRATRALSDQISDTLQSEFEDYYHCKFNKNPDAVKYYDIEFGSEQDATLFILRWS